MTFGNCRPATEGRHPPPPEVGSALYAGYRGQERRHLFSEPEASTSKPGRESSAQTDRVGSGGCLSIRAGEGSPDISQTITSARVGKPGSFVFVRMFLTRCGHCYALLSPSPVLAFNIGLFQLIGRPVDAPYAPRITGRFWKPLIGPQWRFSSRETTMDSPRFTPTVISRTSSRPWSPGQAVTRELVEWTTLPR